MKYLFLTFLLLSSFSNVIHAQLLENGKKSIDLPFEYVNNFIIINAIFNKKLPLKFIFDTGAEHTILAKREFSDFLGIEYDREYKIVGADLSNEISAYLAKNISFRLSKFSVPSVDVLVFKEDYFKFEEITGIEVHGIIGANIFSKYVLSIDYKKRILTLHDPAQFKAPGGKYAVLPISVKNKKPYLQVKTQIGTDKEPIDVKLLLDTGASLSLLLYTDTHESISIPPTVIKGNIGFGLGGSLEGFLGRSHEVKMGDLELNNVITNFQEISDFIDTSFLNGRNGIIGNLILDRFDVTIDYQNRKLFLKPGKKYKQAFKYDRSGLSLIASGEDLSTIVVNHVIEKSPAGEAGIQKGDIIRQVNWLPPGAHSMEDLHRIFQKKVGKKIKLKVKRDGKKMKFKFRLRDLI